MRKTEEARTVLYTKLYTAISKATAETRDAKGNVQKTIFKGFVKDLFKGVNTLTVTKFLWAVSHKTDALRTPLFRVESHSNLGYEIERLHSGFISNETGQRITGTDLVPYIIKAAELYKTKPRKSAGTKVIPEAPVEQKPVVTTSVIDLRKLSDDELAALEASLVKEKARREEERHIISEVQELCELKGLSFEELYEKFELFKALKK